MTRRRIPLGVLLLSSWAGGGLGMGCATRLHPLPEVLETDPEALIERAEARVRERTALAAEAKAEGRARGSGFSGRVTLLVHREGRLRIDAWTPTDLWMATLRAHAGGVLWKRRGEPCHEGPACPRNLEMLVPRGWDLRSTCEALLGRPPIGNGGQSWDLRFDRHVGAWRLETSPGPGAVRRVWIDAQGRFRRFEDRRPGAPPLEWEAMHSTEGILWIRLQSGKDWVRLHLRDVEWDPEIAPEDFEVECSGRTIPMPCTEEPP